MALTKANTIALNAVTTTQTSSAVDVSASYGGEVYVKIVVVGTANTAANFSVLLSGDGTNYLSTIGPFSAGTAAATYNFPPIAYGIGCSSVEVSYTQQSGGTSSTATAHVSRVTAL